MDVSPKITSKKLTDCQSGELVLLPVGREGNLSLALVASQTGSRGQRRYLVLLTGGDDIRARASGSGTLPRYFQPEFDRYGTVLSFGRDYSIEVDHRGPVEMGSGNRLRYQNGALSLHGGAWFLRVHPMGVGHLESAFFGLADGTMPDEEPVECVSFGRWSIYAAGAGPRGLGERAKALVTFSVSAE